MKTLRAFLIMGCGFSSSSENLRLRGSNISCPGMLERARSAGSGSYPTGTWMASGSMGLGVFRFAGSSWPGRTQKFSFILTLSQPKTLPLSDSLGVLRIFNQLMSGPTVVRPYSSSLCFREHSRQNDWLMSSQAKHGIYVLVHKQNEERLKIHTFLFSYYIHWAG